MSFVVGKKQTKKSQSLLNESLKWMDPKNSAAMKEPQIPSLKYKSPTMFWQLVFITLPLHWYKTNTDHWHCPIKLFQKKVNMKPVICILKCVLSAQMSQWNFVINLFSTVNATYFHCLHAVFLWFFYTWICTCLSASLYVLMYCCSKQMLWILIRNCLVDRSYSSVISSVFSLQKKSSHRLT